MLSVYAGREAPTTNADMYGMVAAKSGIPLSVLNQTAPVGKAEAPHSRVKRSFRWMQQNMRRAGVIERCGQQRGAWQITAKAKEALTRAESGLSLVGFSTHLGLALWSSGADAIEQLDEPVHLLLASPPYAIAQGRAYGSVSPTQYIDFICGAIEPVIEKLAPGGSVVLNVANDLYEKGLPSRELSHERLLIALNDRYGLHKMDTLIWHKTSTPPGPVQWASKRRVQLNQSWEPLLWMTNDPKLVFSNNRRVLQPHSAKQARLIAAGGESRNASYSDGAYRIRHGSFANPTAGRIPTNVLSYSQVCGDQRAYKRTARGLGLPTNGAPMPLSLAKFLVEFLTEPGQLVVDRFAGSLTVAKAAEVTGRRWLAIEQMAEFVRGGAERFREAAGFHLDMHGMCIGDAK